jgi:DHA1 family multidrug resistance protein-like MFS transporter
MFTNFVVVPFMSRFKKDFTFMLASMGLAVVAIAITINSTNFIASLYTVFMLFYVANQIFQPFEQSFLANHFDSHHSIIMGLRQSFRAIGLIMAPLLGSALSLINIEYVFYLSIILYVVAGFMIYYVQRRLEN